MIPQFLIESKYRPQPGSIVPYHSFCRDFCKWLDDPVAQLAWLQKNDRVAIALAALGYPVGPLVAGKGRPNEMNGSIWVGNIRGPGCRVLGVAQPIVLEEGCLQPVDLPLQRQREIAKEHRDPQHAA